MTIMFAGAPAMTGLLCGSFFAVCFGMNGLKLAWRPVMSVVVLFCGILFGNIIRDVWLLSRRKGIRCSRIGKSYLLEATSAGLHARLGLAHATSEAHAMASSVDQQPNTIWEVQLVEGNHLVSQDSQSHANKLPAVRLVGIEVGTEDWIEVPDEARMEVKIAERSLKQAQAQAEEAGEKARRSISWAAKSVKEADGSLLPAVQGLRKAAPEEKEAKRRADGSAHADALSAALARAEQAENALQEQQLQVTARGQQAEGLPLAFGEEQPLSAEGTESLSARAEEAERAASVALHRAHQAEAAVYSCRLRRK